MTRNRPGRPGYTLIEILVVMTLIILLAALALGISQTGMFGSQKVISAGDRASGWLLNAKQRALRDGAPRGVRFFNNVGGITGNPSAFTEAVYIENPDPWVPNPAQEGNPSGARIVFVYAWTAGTAPAVNTVTVSEIYFVGAKADLDEYDQRVGDNDSVILSEFGKAFKIAAANVGGGNITANTLIGNPGVALTPTNARRVQFLPASMPDLSAAGTKTVSATDHVATMVTYKFGFQRPAQPLLGEPVLQLTGGTSIDFREPRTPLAVGAAVEPALLGYRTWSLPATGAVNPTPYYPPTTIGVTSQPDLAVTGGSFFDILFSPSGQVLNNNSGLVCLWVRETSKVAHPRLDATSNLDTPLNFDAAGAQVLVVVNTRNGLLSTQPINAPPAAPSVSYDPYAFAKDGINSGL